MKDQMKEMFKTARLVVEDYIKQKGIQGISELVVMQITIAVGSIKHAYNVDWKIALDIFDGMCFYYVGAVHNVKPPTPVQKVEDPKDNVIDITKGKPN